jgi:sulfur-oxidizing protein SoxZ
VAAAADLNLKQSGETIMAKQIRIRAKATGNVVEVKALINHPMDTGQAKDKSGNLIPEYFIQTVEAKVNGQTMMNAQWSVAVSKNPYLAFQYNGKKGDTVDLVCVDNKGETYEGSVKVR